MKDGDKLYTYTDAGFNGFFRRTLKSDPRVSTLSDLPNEQRSLNFDNQQVSGAMGDLFRVGTIVLDGKIGRLKVVDEQDNEVVWLGEVSGG